MYVKFSRSFNVNLCLEGLYFEAPFFKLKYQLKYTHASVKYNLNFIVSFSFFVMTGISPIFVH